MPEPLRYDSRNLDLSARVVTSTTITGSPAAAVETIVCTLPALGDIAAVAGVLLIASCEFTVGTLGVSANLKIRRTNAAGTTVVATGAVNQGALAATELVSLHVHGWDTGPTLPGQVYVATLTVASATAASTVSAAVLTALVV